MSEQREPFDPTPGINDQVHDHVARAAGHLRAAVALLEKIDGVLALDVFKVHEQAARILDRMRDRRS